MFEKLLKKRDQPEDKKKNREFKAEETNVLKDLEALTSQMIFNVSREITENGYYYNFTKRDLT